MNAETKKSINRGTLREYRARHHITQAVFASRLGMNLYSYVRSENGYRQFSEDEIAAIIIQTGMTYEQLTA